MILRARGYVKEFVFIRECQTGVCKTINFLISLGICSGRIYYERCCVFYRLS